MMSKTGNGAAESEVVEENTYAVRLLLCAQGTCAYCYICVLLCRHPSYSLGARSRPAFLGSCLRPIHYHHLECHQHSQVWICILLSLQKFWLLQLAMCVSHD